MDGRGSWVLWMDEEMDMMHRDRVYMEDIKYMLDKIVIIII